MSRLPVERTRHRTITVIVAAGAVIEPILQGVTVPVLPQLQHRLAADQESASWILTAFLLSSAIASPIGGRLGDRWGRTRIWTGSLVLITLGSLLAMMSTTIGWMVAARVLQGLGAAAVPLSFGILRDQLPPLEARNATATVSALLWVGFASAVAAAGPIAEQLGLNWLFLAPAILSAGVAVFAYLLLPESPTLSSDRVRLLPAVALSAWLVSLLLGLGRGATEGWSRPVSLALLGTAAVTFAAWVLIELRIEHPLVDLRLLRPRAAWSASVVAFTLGMALFASMGLLPTFYQTPHVNGVGFGSTATESSLIMLPSSCAGFVAGALAARLAARTGVRATLVAGCLVAGGGLLGFAVSHDRIWQAMVATCCVSIGAGVVFSNIANVIMDAVPAHATGTALGVNANTRIVGGAVGTAVAVTIVANVDRLGGMATETGYVAAFIFLAAACVAAALASCFAPGGGSGKAPRASV